MSFLNFLLSLLKNLLTSILMSVILFLIGYYAATKEFPPKREKIDLAIQKFEDLKKLQGQLLEMSQQAEKINNMRQQEIAAAQNKANLISQNHLIDHEILNEPTAASADPQQQKTNPQILQIDAKELARRINNLELSMNKLRTQLDALEDSQKKLIQNQAPSKR